uniref:Protein kinase domain-containing protein n=1 Tax=Phytophthora ramorum TaxID=164328 RepID=H3GPQ6_PHYRM
MAQTAQSWRAIRSPELAPGHNTLILMHARRRRRESLALLAALLSPCVDDATAVSRRLQTSADSGADDSRTGSSSDVMDGASRGSKSAADQDTSTLVLLSMGLPFLYFLYKVGLAVFFMLTYKKTHGDNRPTDTKHVDINDSDADRPTTNDSSTSPPASPSPRPHRRQDKEPFTSNNAGFWVDEELQPWRLDFQRLKMLKCLNLLPAGKRQTLRKQSVTSAMNPREIWLASYAASTAAVSPGGGTTDTLVVVKFLTPKEDQGPRSSASGGGGGSARDKLKGELKRQAIFSHPQIVAFIGVAWSRETHLVAVTEYMAQGDLRQWLHRTAHRQAGKWSVLKVQMLLDVTRALLYLHSMHPRLVHGNCNSRNVLLSTSLRAKLSDFGVDGRSDGLTEQELMSYSAVGSGRWITPEAIMGRDTSASYPDASDVYSFGILIAEMDSHELPFSDLMQANRSAVPETDILQLIARGALTPTLSPTCPKSIVKLVSACTSYKPKYRPSSTQVQQDLLRILEDFREFESQTTATISVGAPSSHRPSNLV